MANYYTTKPKKGRDPFEEQARIDTIMVAAFYLSVILTGLSMFAKIVDI